MKQLTLHTFLLCRAAPWPLLLAALCCVLGTLLWAVVVSQHTDGERLSAMLCAFPALGWYGLGGIALLDAVARFIDYQRIRTLLERYGFRERVFRVVASSRCQRDAALLAARQTGHHPQARKFFRDLGYRWYHLLPDKIANNPFQFFNPSFLRQAFLPSRNR
ncbi:MAG: hypothetical protein V3573_05590 [Desulfovibrionaceae bacterium]